MTTFILFSQFIGFKVYHIVLLIITVDYCELKAILQNTVNASLKLYNYAINIVIYRYY